MPGSEIDWESKRMLRFRLCLRCFRAVPSRSDERYCINDGTPLLEACPWCGAAISNPYARFCGACGLEYSERPHRKENSA